MRVSSTHAVLAVLLTITASTAAPPDEASSATQAKPAVDRYGDPLPKGVVGRLGTARLRHAGSVNGVAFSPDGKTLASTAWNRKVRLWDVKTAKPIRRLPGKQYGSFFAAAYSPDGNLLAAVGDQGRVHLWMPETGEELFHTQLHMGRTYGVAFAPDGKTFASAGQDRAIRVWNILTGKQDRVFDTGVRVRDHHAVAFSPDGKWLASGAGKTIHLWNLTKGGKHKTIATDYRRAIVSLHYTPDGKHLISSGYRYVSDTLPDGQRVGRSIAGIDVWDPKTLKKTRTFKDGKARMSECSTALSKDGKTLVSVHYDRIRIWDVKSGKLRRTIRDYFNSFGVRTHGVALSPDGKTLAARGPGVAVLLWDVTTGKRLHRFPDSHDDRVLSTAVSPNGKLVATSAGDGTMRLWNSTTGKAARVLRFGYGKLTAANSIAFSADGSILAAGGYDNDPLHSFIGTVEFWDVASGKKFLSKTASDRVQAVAFAPDGKTIAVAAGLGAGSPKNHGRPSIAIWGVAGGKEIAKLEGHENRIRWMSFSKDGKQLTSVDSGGSIHLWNLSRKKKADSFYADGHRRNSLTSAAFSLDRKILATSGLFGDRVILRDAKTGKELRRLTIENSSGSVLAFSPDGRILASDSFGSSPKTGKSTNALRLWQVASGKLIAKFDHPGIRGSCLVFTPDGKQLYSGMNDGTTLVWDTSVKK